jgi:alkylation response protein AidB-like acyl-CoA dehydrogenase
MSTELRLLEDAAERLLAEHFPVSRLRAMIGDEARYQDGVRELRRRAGELGWFGFGVPEEFGGGSLGGHGIIDAVLVARQRGRALAPGPYTDIHVAASVIAGCGEQRADLLAGLARGERVVACVSGDVRAEELADRIVLTGRARPVAYGADADTLLVRAGEGGRVRRFLVPADAAGIKIGPLEGLDVLARAAEVVLEAVTTDRSAEIALSPAAEQDVATGAVLTAADATGAMDRLLEMTVEYARQRQAFGRVIGSFQAVKHQIADISMLVEASRAVTDAAAEAIATGHRDAVEIAHIAKAFVSDQSHQVGQVCLQLHGGIGYAWEHDLHLYLRRLAADAVAWGSAREHRAAIASLHLGPA